MPELLGGYFVPTTIQTQLIHDTLSIAQSYMSQIDNEIIRLTSDVEELQSKPADLLKYTQSHIALSAPVRRFPPEILSEIFLHCLETKWFNPAYYERFPRLDKAPLLLGSVCRQWRTIALSTPRLWASFTLTIRPKHLKFDVVLAKTWLGRAGRCPLSINLESEGSCQNPMRPLMQVFALNCERWYESVLFLPPAVMASLSSVKNRLPRLQKLTIRASSATIIDQFSCAPRLRHLNLGSIIPPSIITVPWNQLQCLTLQCLTIGMCRADSCLEYLRLTPNLLECTLSLKSGSLLGSQPPVQLPQLRSIILRGDPSCILDSLQVPELREVSICPRGYRWIATPRLTSLFSRCSLRVFSFDFNAIIDCPSDNDMIQLLQASPTLVELHFRNRTSQCMTSSFLTQFASHQGSGDSSASLLVPSLHTMTVDWSPLHFNILEFAESIRSRMAFNVLQKVEICHADTEFLRSAAPSRLRELRDIGLDIRVPHPNRDLI
jgi:F-box-like